jgi:hypothetical protein
MSVTPSSPGFNLDKGHRSPSAGDEVDFSVAATPPSIEHLVSVRNQKVAGNSFTPSPQFVFTCHCSSPIRVGL